MGFPAQGVEGYFRNNIIDIARYLNERHKVFYSLRSFVLFDCAVLLWSIINFSSAFSFDSLWPTFALCHSLLWWSRITFSSLICRRSVSMIPSSCMDASCKWASLVLNRHRFSMTLALVLTYLPYAFWVPVTVFLLHLFRSSFFRSGFYDQIFLLSLFFLFWSLIYRSSCAAFNALISHIASRPRVSSGTRREHCLHSLSCRKRTHWDRHCLLPCLLKYVSIPKFHLFYNLPTLLKFSVVVFVACYDIYLMTWNILSVRSCHSTAYFISHWLAWVF